MLCSSSSRTRRCSLVVPEGPAAEPRLAPRRFATKRSHDNATLSGGWCVKRESSIGTCLSLGRLCASVSSVSVASVPGAIGSETNAVLPADSSPKCPRAAARRARRSIVSAGVPLGADPPYIAAACPSRSAHRPVQKRFTRRSISSSETFVSPLGLASSILGAR